MVKRLLVATLVAIGPLLAFAQNVITGRVIDAKTGEPLIGTSVIVKTDKQGVATDLDGNFSLTTRYHYEQEKYHFNWHHGPIGMDRFRFYREICN